MHFTRRTFIRSLAAACAAGGTGLTHARHAPHRFQYGMRTEPDLAERIKARGYDFIEIGVLTSLKPEIPDADFAPELEKLKHCALPIRSANRFIPPELKLTGHDPQHDAALEYAATACRRADALGIPFIVLGSGTARRIPEGFDHAKGKAQFIDFCRKLGDRIQDLKVTIVIEQLRSQETNLINTLVEGIECVDAIGHEKIQLLADFYHMRCADEGPDSIRKAGARIRHCHIAELEGRMAPGTKGEDFSGYFAALKDIGYTGGISVEARWPEQNLEAAWDKALTLMRSQSGI